MINTIGFIGTGNMGGALAKAAAKAMPAGQIYLTNRTAAKAEALADCLGCQVATKEHVASECGFLFLGVKPQQMGTLLNELSPILVQRKDEFVLVTMAAGLTMERIQTMAGGAYPVIRIMPNTPCAVGEGVIMYDKTENVSDTALALFLEDMQFAGVLDHLPENLIDAGSAVAGCGPAYAAMFLEALADGGVACGLPRQKALLYASQMLLGSAKLALETGKHPGVLKDEVCSPGGSTIAGVRALEEGAFRAAVIDAVKRAHERNQALGK
ncbi:MAG: pyrroline-5-carboxylate reductase [Oscillospiraceae bacterium]|nr:pyrroline-5-carboxylate reductase [Oscillospiraceae bacterium]